MICFDILFLACKNICPCCYLDCESHGKTLLWQILLLKFTVAFFVSVKSLEVEKMKSKVMKRIVPMLLVVCLVLGMSGCGSSDTAADTDSQKPVILAVSFGTSYNDSRDVTIGAVEKALQDAYPDYEVRRAFTSQIVIDILEDRDGLDIDNVTEAMDRLVADGVKEVIVQPTHVMTGFEYDDVVAEVNKYSDKFDTLKISDPLLVSDSDYDALVKCLEEETASYNEEGTAIVFMGHGTEHESNATYATLQTKLNDAGLNNYFIGTVEAEPSLDDVVALVKDSGAKKVVLLPLMIVAGDHANNDMAGDEDDSWKSTFAAEGFEVECVLKGLGEYEGVQKILTDHAAAAIAK